MRNDDDIRDRIQIVSTEEAAMVTILLPEVPGKTARVYPLLIVSIFKS